MKAPRFTKLAPAANNLGLPKTEQHTPGSLMMRETSGKAKENEKIEKRRRRKGEKRGQIKRKKNKTNTNEEEEKNKKINSRNKL